MFTKKMGFSIDSLIYLLVIKKTKAKIEHIIILV